MLSDLPIPERKLEQSWIAEDVPLSSSWFAEVITSNVVAVAGDRVRRATAEASYPLLADHATPHLLRVDGLDVLGSLIPSYL